jgi:hypothetical protein
MTRSSRRHSPVQPERPTPEPTAPPSPAADQPRDEKQPLSRRWQIVFFLWITAFLALALFEFLQAIFRLW